MYRNIAHFPNLTPLRFIAAYLVLIFHVEETRKMFGTANLTSYSLFTNGPLAVTFFFVLSGFLITFLLLREHHQTGRIAVTRFYIRRMLRIWPLYFLMVVIGLVLIPAAAKLGRVPYESPYDSIDVAAYYLLFVPFVVNLLYGNHFLTPLWSIGVEEMYYLSWAPVARWFRRRLGWIMVSVVLIKAGLAIAAHYFWQNGLVVESLRMLQFEAMAIGGLAAYFVFHRVGPLHQHWLFSRPMQALLMLPLAARLFVHESLAASYSLYAALFDHALFSPWLVMLLFGWFVANVAVNERTIVRFRAPVLDCLGNVSYGIYMYHALAISLVFVPLLKKYQALPFWAATLLLHAAVAALTLAFAAASKKYFEDVFLRHKNRFSPAAEGSSRAQRPLHPNKARPNVAA
jgi:peptidoglycan/LPS O-acetylase OafA/YrhL